MKILTDLVAVQSEGSRGRGIGRYSEELSKEILKFIPEDIIILLNSLYPEHKGTILNDYKEFIEKKNIKEYTILDISDKPFEEKAKFNSLNSYLMQKQFSQSEDIDMIHFHSVFEGLVGKADILNSFSNMKALKTVVTLYDLIPLIYKDIYLSDENVKRWYFNKLRLLYEADILLAISDATKEDAINILGIPEHKVINISGAIDGDNFYKMDKRELEKNHFILEKHNITQSFVLYTGGIDFRKNIESSIKAFAQIKNLDSYQYVIVCKISDQEKENFQAIIKKLKIPKNKIIFTGFISNEELNFLYNKSSLFIFPSIYEGFGLPLLEAMSCATAVIGSNISSIPEIIGRDDCMFDPTNIDDIAKKIDSILGDDTLKLQLENYFYERSKEFSWKKSAHTAIEAYKALHQKNIKTIKKIKVAFFTPLPPQRSGISDYCLELLPFLSKYMDIDIYIDDYSVDSDYLNNNFTIYNYREFEQVKDRYENIIYQFGNSQYHEYMYDIALNNPGIVVLHDFFLSGLVQYMAHKQDDPQFFFDNLTYSHDKLGAEYLDKILSGVIDVEKTTMELPINKKIVDSAKAIIVHSDYAKNLFKHYYKESSYNVVKIEQLIKTPSQKFVNSKEKYKQKLNLHSDDIVISAFGHISDTKQYDFILECFIEANIFEDKHIKLFFVGEFLSDIYKAKISTLIKNNKIQNQVYITGFVDDEVYKDYLLASDIGVNLRVNSRGETSRALLMNMAYALPTIINDYASFSELPEDATIKVVLNSKEDFIKKIKILVDDKLYRDKIATTAYNYIVAKHSIDELAQEYYDITLESSKLIETKNDTIKEIATILIDNELNDTFSENEYYLLAKILKNGLC